uniref:Protein yippee-like n=1 Tax=Mantoniella antarctica TaxID=81844 RepID=A0A7S0SU86_9CHLO|mmetsp:Transcript_35177/g.87990  ORF Transcript_35177/g.87990 Transcript_35177/m.87990 type:complete len:130 (+) Transcript_35177:429-818(+)
MGRLFICYLEGRVYSCKACKAHLAKVDELVSKSFHCRHGKAYLFNDVVNVKSGPKEDRLMTTGLHTVADIYCNKCLQVVGWKYEVAFEKSQKYKEGKFILERAKMTDADDERRTEGGLPANHLESDGED